MAVGGTIGSGDAPPLTLNHTCVDAITHDPNRPSLANGDRRQPQPHLLVVDLEDGSLERVLKVIGALLSHPVKGGEGEGPCEVGGREGRRGGRGALLGHPVVREAGERGRSPESAASPPATLILELEAPGHASLPHPHPPHCTYLNSSLSARELTPGSVSGPSIVCVLPDPV